MPTNPTTLISITGFTGMLLVALSSATVDAQLVIDSDTTIDYHIDETEVHIVARRDLSPPTNVDIIHGAHIDDDLSVFDTSNVNISGGQLDERFWAFDHSRIFINGGMFGDEMTFAGNSRAIVTGGDVDDMWLGDNAYLQLLNANGISDVTAQGDSSVDMLGGELSAAATPVWSATDSGTFHIYGSGFNYPLGPIVDRDGVLSGFLQSGQSISVAFHIRDAAAIVLVPEPSPLLPSGLAISFSLCLLRRRSQDRWGHAVGTRDVPQQQHR